MEEKNGMEYCFSWKIKNYSMCFRNYGEFLRSPAFIPSNLVGSRWYLTFYPSGKIMNAEFCSLCLNRSSEDLGDEVMFFSFLFEIIDGNGRTIANRGSINGCKCKVVGKGVGLKCDDIVSMERINRDILSWKEDSLIIRFWLNSIGTTVSRAVTDIEVDKYSFTWEVSLNDCLTDGVTRKFSISKSSRYEIFINSKEDRIEIEIDKQEDNAPSARIMRGKIFLLNRSGVSVLSQSAKHLFDSADDAKPWSYPSFISRNFLEENKKDCIKNGAFSLYCEFSVANGSELCMSNNPSSTRLNNVIDLFCDLQKMCLNIKHSDIKLKTEDSILPAHKALLSARSDVFSAMFDKDMLESQSGIVDISDTDAETLKSFLEFIYTTSLTLKDYKTALKLLMTAEKYQVLSLKESCSYYLICALSVENVCEILAAVDMFNIREIKRCAMDYITKHMIEISNSTSWLEHIGSNAKLSGEIFSYFATHFELKPKKN